jgi:hypothetical protein
LSIIWLASKPPHDTSFPARAWADLLDLPDPEKAGARRVKHAIDWLGKNHFLKVQPHAGHPSVIYLRDDAGRKTAYSPPGEKGEIYIKLPHTLWTNGWMAILSGTAIALLLILLDFSGASSTPFWMSPSLAASQYGLSPDSWTRAKVELEYHELVSVLRVPISPSAFSERRMRNQYAIELTRLESPP